MVADFQKEWKVKCGDTCNTEETSFKCFLAAESANGTLIPFAWSTKSGEFLEAGI